MNQPSDQPQRARFAQELTRNFSVVASAGSGKTHAITERILALAASRHAREWLPQLVVVTFTNRAAEEMQQRARQRLLESGASIEVIEAFNRSFFGTIHSFCLKLLRAHGHRIGLPSNPEMLTDDTALWREFVQQTTTIGGALPEDQRRVLFRLVSAATVLELGRRNELSKFEAMAPGSCPPVDLAEVLRFPGKGSARKNIERSQKAAREWQRLLDETSDFAEVPAVLGESRDFVPVWDRAFGPLRRWIQNAARCVGCEVSRDFRAFRLKRGALTFDDQVTLAARLFEDPEIAQRIREKNYRVILDEAQDTDPEQFMVLLQTAADGGESRGWPEGSARPRPGHFCMVGDFQQSIYGRRADLRFYRQIHEALVADSHGDGLTFSVTFRLDTAAIGFVNKLFPQIFQTSEGQVPFQPLQARPEIFSGQVLRLDLPLPEDKEGENDAAWRESEFLAQWLKSTGLEKLRAVQWSDVAILCPRKRWFGPLRTALRQLDFDVQLQSERELRGDHPVVAWFTALIVVMAEPHHAFELAGVLREIFGVSDHDLAVFTARDSKRLNIAERPEGRGTVVRALRLLHDLREHIAGEPLFEQVEEIVAGTRLRARALSLPAEEYEGLSETLDELILAAAVVESEGLGLKAFADRLRDDFEKIRESRATRPTAIQIITGHKAKGSEWPVVIVPMLGRKVYPRPISYPMVISDEHGDPLVVFNKADRDGSAKEVVDRRDRHEAERLLYVTLTRAKHTLVLVDDRASFRQGNGMPKEAQARLLKLSPGSANEAAFLALPTSPFACDQTMEACRGREDQRLESARVVPLRTVAPDELAQASSKAEVFIKRNPSGLVLPPSRAAQMDATKMPEPTAPSLAEDYPGKAYGIWWHGLIELLDFQGDPGEWQPHLDQAYPRSPDPARSKVEWTLFVEASAARRQRWVDSARCYAEMPFLWRMSDFECVEGVIDLATYDARTKSWWIIDWKTNTITAGQAAWLKEKYEPQLAAYRAALIAITRAPVHAAIYSTPLGVWMEYDDAVLDARWKELAKSPEAIEEALCS